MIYTVCIVALFCVFTAAQFALYSQVKDLRAKADNLEDMLAKDAAYTAELSDRLEAAEDYMKIIRSETENDKHSDYWASVMNYNPYIEKEGEK